MQSSLRALLTNLIDYAGLFPPAALPLDQAIRNYARYQQEPESWMLGRFICPAKQLEELPPFAETLFVNRRPIHISALGPSAINKEETFLAGLVCSLAQVRQFQERCPRIGICDVLESRLSDDICSLPLTKKLVAGMDLFFEPTLGDKWRDDVTGAITVVTTSIVIIPPVMGLKLRCGGLHASAFPTPEQIAFTIAACRDAKIPLKFTAGLHHPLRHFKAGVQTHMHGFINVFVAGVLAHARGLSEEQLRQIIEDEDANDFVFDGNGLRWKEHRATTEEIIRARKYVPSFGSCSFDEPREDLRKLGWLP